MTTTYPTTKDNLINPLSTDKQDVVSHADQHSNANDAIEAIETKLGINGDTNTSSHDYKLSEITGSDKAVSKTATQTLTNKTLTSPTITGATITTSTINGVDLKTNQGTSTFLRGDGTYAPASAADASYSQKGSVQGLTDADTSGLVINSGVISVNTGTTANKIVKLDGSGKLPAVSGENLTNVIKSNDLLSGSGIVTFTASNTEQFNSGTISITNTVDKRLLGYGTIRIKTTTTGDNTQLYLNGTSIETQFPSSGVEMTFSDITVKWGDTVRIQNFSSITNWKICFTKSLSTSYII